MTAINHAASEPQYLLRRKDPTGRVVEPGLVYFPRYDEQYKALAELARPEDWGEAWVVLRKYLDYTVHQLLREGKVMTADTSRGDAVMAFNTGLLTPDTRPIFCFATQNHNELEQAQPWYFTRWGVDFAGAELLYLHG